MKLTQLCIGSAAVMLVYGNQAHACDGQDLLSDCAASRNVYQNLSAVEGQKFNYPSYDNLDGSIDTFISPFAIDASTIVTTSLICPSGFVCGATIVGFPSLQLEYTDGTSVWFQKAPATIALDPNSPWIFTYGPVEPPPLHLFHTQTGLTLKLGAHQLSPVSDPFAEPPQPTLDQNQHFLLMSRDSLISDTAYIELNQQGEAEQKIYRSVVDAEIAGVATGADAKLSAQLSVPLNIPNSYEMRMRVLTDAGWGDFISDEHNHLAAANKLDSGYCPEVGSDLYQNEFGTGSECLQLTIQDGGPNDDDGTADGSVAVTMGLVLKAIELVSLQEDGSTTTVEAAQTTGTNAPTPGGGGAWPWWLSLALLFRLGRSKRN